MLNPGLLLERPLHLKEGRTYLIVQNTPDGFLVHTARYKEYISEWAIPSNMIFQPHWEIDNKSYYGFSRIEHTNNIIPYKIPNGEEYQKNIDHFLGF